MATTSACDPAATAGSAIELYQASALVHDDVIDDSPTRRGNPAAHVAFTNLHTEGRWLYSPADFGRASAIVLGDLLLSEASKEFQAAAAMVAPREGATAFRVSVYVHRSGLRAVLGYPRRATAAGSFSGRHRLRIERITAQERQLFGATTTRDRGPIGRWIGRVDFPASKA